MPVPMGSKGQAGFDQPIELMMDCHRRIENFLGVLSRVVDEYRDRGLDQQARDALQTSLNYFRQAAPRHTEDEEHSLFPRMRKADDAQVRQVMAALQRLESDHRKMEAAHVRVDEIGRRWLDDGKLDSATHAEVRALLSEMAAGYAQHIRLEDEEVFVLASKVLDADALAAVGKEMKQRRVDDPGRPGSRCAQRRTREYSHRPGQAAPG
jgi:hemerythrin-like domain-containing protein